MPFLAATEGRAARPLPDGVENRRCLMFGICGRSIAGTPMSLEKGTAMFENIRGHTICVDALGPQSVVVDLGANLGDFSRLMKARLGGGQFLLVEANPVLADKIRQKGEFPVWTYAMSAQTGKVSFNVSKNIEGSSMLTLPRESIWNSVLEKTIEVEALTLDRLMEITGTDRIDLLKMDIEGSEIDVINSISKPLLDKIGQITVEFHGEPMFGFDLAPAVETALAHLQRNRFICMDFSEGTRRDVLFLNRRVHDLPWRKRLMWRFRTHRPGWLVGAWLRVPAFWRTYLYRLIDRS